MNRETIEKPRGATMRSKKQQPTGRVATQQPAGEKPIGQEVTERPTQQPMGGGASRRATTEKIVVLVLSFALFIGGVAALSMDRGTGRTIILACVFGALLCIAARQTLRHFTKKR